MYRKLGRHSDVLWHFPLTPSTVDDGVEGYQERRSLMRADKCGFRNHELKFLAHAVSATGVRPNWENTSSVPNVPTRKIKKLLRSFLGLCSYCRRFVFNYKKFATPVTQLTKNQEDFISGRTSTMNLSTRRTDLPPPLC